LVGSARGHGVRGALLLALAYAPTALLGLPAAPLTMAAGAAYGPWVGAALSVPAGALSALLPFLVGRRFAARHPEALAQGTGRIARTSRALGRGGLRLVLVLRLSWVAPFGVLNYAFGASPCRLSDFLLGSLVGNAPVALGYAFAGAALMAR
ncbi:MAG TPA: VTT domain-containing protein, partial [Anaeromyxobacteraceae bacterium]|nr:VTT domain-containing protein [Anaeromyxobacteraceae bacterium]